MKNKISSENTPSPDHRYASIGNVKMHYVISGTGPWLVLLHGMAGTWYSWRYVIPVLAAHFTVLAPDLRGFGDSEKPPQGYDKKTLAGDIRVLVHHLGHESCLVAGHDFGGPIGYALAANYPGLVRRLAVFECLVLLPTAQPVTPPWFVTFFQTPEIPEILLKGHEREFLETWRSQLTVNKAAMTAADFDEYGRTYALPGCVGAAAGLYRSFPIDLEDNVGFAKTKLTIPILAFGADAGMADSTPKLFGSLGENVRGGVVPDCGHFVPEERPEFVANQLLAFFGEDLE